MELTCEVGGHPFSLTAEDVNEYKKFGFEPLSICFAHQHQWRLSFRNDRFLHRRTCDLTGASIISMYPPDAPYTVYEREAWFSDKWDALSYGRPFDFNRPFFEQYAQLQQVVPRVALVNVGSINSDYCNSCVFNKDCYLIFGGDRNEDCMFGSLPMRCRSCVDCDWTTNCELCYFCAYSRDCYNCRFTFHSKNCSDCAFVENCIGCSDCILSFDLANKRYCIENKQYSREEYLERKQKLLDGTYKKQQELWKRFKEMRQRRIVKYATIINSENCTGDLIYNSKNCRNVYECIGSEDCAGCWTIFESKDCFNTDYIGHNCPLNYNNISADTAYRTWFSYYTVGSSDIEYCELINFSKNLFGCIGVNHNQYCILNKKYPKEDFEKLRLKIIEHMKKTASQQGERAGERGAGFANPSKAERINQEWGRFFPKELSTFPYNESTAFFFFPQSKGEAIANGFRWRDEKITPSSQTYEIPDEIGVVPDSITNEILACESTGKNYRITEQELKFYRIQNIPIPRRHPDTRYSDRLALRNTYLLYERACKKCGAPVQTSYAPNRPETIYCEACYLKTIY